jgi:predicted small lipoprotein YifL
MLRRVLALSLVLASLAACGGSSPTEAPSEAPVTSAPVEATVAPSEAPSSAPVVDDSLPRTVVAQCTGVGLRADPSTSGSLVARVSTGVKVRATELVSGSAYTAGTCGTAGDTWYRITKVGGKTVKSLYGVTPVYAASGFFE